MRLVFLFVAEERRLLAERRPLLRRDPRRQPRCAPSSRSRPTSTARTCSSARPPPGTGSWPFRAVHGGVEHERATAARLRRRAVRPRPVPVPRRPQPGSRWHEPRGPSACRSTTARCCTCSMRCSTLESGRRALLLTYRALDVEQIGHVYEGLLDHTAVRTTDTVARAQRQARSRARPRRARPMVGDRQRHADRAPRRRGPAARRSRSARHSPASCPTSNAPDCARPCGNDDPLLDRVAPYHALLRRGPARRPARHPARQPVRHPGRSTARATGTHYTPRQLAEEVVRQARSSPSSTALALPRSRTPAQVDADALQASCSS